MKTFKDLVFEPYYPQEGLHAKMFFNNGYGISVLRFIMPLPSNKSQWEVAILFGDEKESVITYNTPIADKVLSNQSEDDVTEVMRQVQLLNSGTTPDECDATGSKSMDEPMAQKGASHHKGGKE